MDLSRRLEYVLTGIYGSAYEGYVGVDMMIYRDGKPYPIAIIQAIYMARMPQEGCSAKIWAVRRMGY